MKKRFFLILLLLPALLVSCNSFKVPFTKNPEITTTEQNQLEKEHSQNSQVKSEDELNETEQTVNTNGVTDPFEDASFLRDPKYTYIYKYEDGSVSTETIASIVNDNEQIWNYREDDYHIQHIFQNREEGLFVGYPYSEGSWAIVYPVKVGQKWENCDYEDDCIEEEIVELLDSYQTPAGTFEDVVVVKREDGSRLYYAKNIGELAILDQHGNKIKQLSALIE